MITIGVMTGNSLDGVDAVLTEFNGSRIRDIAGVTLPYSQYLKKLFSRLNAEILKAHSNMSAVSKTELFSETLDAYNKLIIKACLQLMKKAHMPYQSVAAVCISGQSVGAHNPPSVCGNTQPFTTQIFDAATVAEAINIPVVYDIRSDDIFNGGEGAPLAPVHNLHLSVALAKDGYFPVCFINGGNTANVAVISNSGTIRRQISGFDCGAFNHYVDALTRYFFDKPFDEDGMFGTKGEINPLLLRQLYQHAAITADGENFYDLFPPKSSGPHLYNMLHELKHYPLCPEDILRTVEYFSAYSVFLSLRFIPQNFDFPSTFIVFGGGWKNPVIYYDFSNLLHGRGIILPEHQVIVDEILNKMNRQSLFFGRSDDFNISSQFMEARIMADMARCYLKRMEFTRPEITGCNKGAVCGKICYPRENIGKNGRGYTYSRAAKGWRKAII